MNERDNITLGSLFDGIGGFPYAASFYGIKTLWASEIIPAAISVTRRHFPDMEHVGDITKLNGGEVAPVHIITFGSPCQSFSIAGGRKGLEGKSGLFWEAIRIIREMRKATHGKYPRYCIFENVPGILSANRGRDYKTVLEAFTETEIPMPPSGKWTNAGMVRGGRIDFAWVIHNAQYFGVAQRRRRLFAVCDFTGQRAAEILFKPKSLHGHFTQGAKARERTAVDASGCAHSANSKEVETGFSPCGINGEVSATLDASYHKGTGARGGIEREVVLCAATGQANAEILQDLSATLNCNCEQPIVYLPDIPALTMRIRQGCDGGGKGALIQSDKSGTLATGNDQILFCVATTQVNAEICDNLCPTVTEAAGKSGTNKPYIAYSLDSLSSNSMKSKNPHSGCREVELAKTIDTANQCPSKNQGGLAIVQPVCAPHVVRPQICGTLCASGAGLSRPAGMGSETDLCIVTGTEPIPINDRATRHIGGGGTRNNDGSGNGLGIGKSGEPCPTLTSGDRHAVAAYCLQGNLIGRKDENGPRGSGINEGISFTLNTVDQHAVATVFNRQRSDSFGQGDLASTQTARQSKDATDLICQTTSVSAVDCRDCCKPDGSCPPNYQNPVHTGYVVRRLTPTECERLQGYEDSWTEYGHDGKPLSDTARYQACGNSVAIPCVAYVLSGIVDEIHTKRRIHKK